MQNKRSGLSVGDAAGQAIADREMHQSRSPTGAMPFDQWCAALDEYAASVGHGDNTVEQTGADCWREYYDDGYSPRDAYDEDLWHGL